MQEIEILVAVNTDKATALTLLQSYGTPSIRRISDTYYTHPDVALLRGTLSGQAHGSLRIRTENGKHTLTAKHDNFDGDRWLYSDEHDLALTDEAAGRELLAALGFTVAATLQMERHAYHSGDFEIVLDDVEGLGLFLEVEAKTYDEDGLTTKAKVREFLRSLPLPLGEELNEGKFELALRAKRTQ